MAKKIIFSFNPNVWLRMTLQAEIGMDKEGKIFNDDLYNKYLAMHEVAISRQDGLMKAVLVSDFALAFVVIGRSLEIPGIGLSITELPAARECLLIISAFSFMLFCQAFFNAQAYLAVIQVMSQRKVSELQVDPDFHANAHVYSEWFPKLFRKKFNLHGVDFYTPNWGYRTYYGFLYTLLILSAVGLLALHVALTTWGVMGASLSGLSFWTLALIVAAMNLAAIMLVTSLSFPFESSDVSLVV